MTEISNNSIERYRASLRATRARIDRRLESVLDKLDDERVYGLPDTAFGKLIGERDELALASEDLKLLCEEFELFVKNEI